jgi:hypothetical protein
MRPRLPRGVAVALADCGISVCIEAREEGEGKREKGSRTRAKEK